QRSSLLLSPVTLRSSPATLSCSSLGRCDCHGNRRPGPQHGSRSAAGLVPPHRSRSTDTRSLMRSTSLKLAVIFFPETIAHATTSEGQARVMANRKATMLALGADPRAQTGLMRTVNDPSLLGETPTALCTNYTAVTDNLERGIDALLAAGAPITSLLTPEHGYWGAVQAGQSEGDGHDAATGLPVWDTYQLSGEALDALLATSGAAQIAFDVQDIGTRFYTYTWTLFDLLCSCARRGLPL